MQITKKIETETGHRLVNYNGKCAHLHGHRYQWEVTVSAAELDPTGFVMDYGDLKQILKETVDLLDHAFIFSDQDPIVKTLQDQRALELLNGTNGEVGRIHIVPFNPTTENLLPWVATMINIALTTSARNTVVLEKITVYETSGSFAEWYKSDQG